MLHLQDKPKLKKIIGLRNIITNGKEWKYLLFYEIDNQLENNINEMKECFNFANTSFIIYKTKHGIHGVGLTPKDIIQYSISFNLLQEILPEYYSGQTLRLTPKEGETQELIYWNLNYPYVSEIFQIYLRRFPKLQYAESEHDIVLNEWNKMLEKYWSRKH